jgi:hypothetical protein
MSSAVTPSEANVAGPPSVPFTAPAALVSLEQTHAQMRVSDPAHASDTVVVALPKTWSPVDHASDAHRALFEGRVLQSFGPRGGENRPVVTLVVTPIPFEISIDAWGRMLYENDGFNILVSRYFPGPQGLFFDITGTRTENGRELVKRTFIRKDGNRVFTMSALCPREAWDANKDNFWIANVTFEVLHPQSSGRAEAWLTASTKKPGFEISFPASWQVERAASKSDSISGFHLRLPDADGQTLLSYLLVRCERAPASDLPALQRDTIAMLQKSGVATKGDLQQMNETADPRAVAVQGWLGGFRGIAHMGTDDVIVTLGFVRRGDLTFTFALCNPKANANPVVALRAQRTFEVARATLKTEND